MTTKASAPGKVILLGEHAAVYGNPVLVASVALRTYVKIDRRGDDEYTLNNRSTNIKNLRFSFSDLPKLKKEWGTVLTAECIDKTLQKLDEKSGLDIELFSEIPVASGMGSSASASSALCYSIAKELGHELEKKEIADLAWSVENIVHGRSSGVDPYAVTFGGVLRYKKGDFVHLKIKEYPEVTVGNTGVKSNTLESVGDVMKLKEAYPEFFDDYLSAMKHIVDYGQRFLEEGDFRKFGEIMNVNHGLLSSIGVSSPELERLVWAARKVSLGAKLCGAGRGGIMVALGDASKEIEKAGGKVIKTKITDDGVRIESNGS
ncbi:MAG: mevalonate kinase [Candidatus Altiarchaeota archaeon]|nr:mevalonate kinase [Candidatus Altiarchaeota archaeon]